MSKDEKNYSGFLVCNFYWIDILIRAHFTRSPYCKKQ